MLKKYSMETRNVLKGAILQVAVKSVDHVAFNVWYTASGNTDAPRVILPYWYGVGQLNVTYDDYWLDLALPAGLALIGKMKKSGKIKDMALGASLTGVATFLTHLLSSPQLLPLSTPSTPLIYTTNGKYGRNVMLPMMAVPSQRSRSR